MKIFVIGIDGATAEHLFSDERLENIRRLMEFGCYGKLSFDAASDRLGMWMSLVTSQDVSSLGGTESKDKESYEGQTIWKQIEEQNKNVIVVGSSPFISYPVEIETRIKKLLLDKGLTEENLTDNDNTHQINHIYGVSSKQIEFVRNLVKAEEWDYFQFVDDGLYELQKNRLNISKNSSQDTLTDYYLYLDEQIGAILELLDDNTIVLVVSLQGTLSKDGGFILAFSNNPLKGEVEGAHLLDIAPTLMGLGEYEAPTSMQGMSLVAGKTQEAGPDKDLTAEEEEILREQLSGLGYL